MPGMDRSVRCRLSQAEWEHVRDRAAAMGCSASSYVRHAVAAYALASDAAGGEPPTLVGVDDVSVREISRELVMQGVNLNQAAHALNTAALAAQRADSGLSDDDRRVLLGGVEEARLALPEVSGRLAALHGCFRELLKRRFVEVPPPMKKAKPGRSEGEAAPCR